jgi:hypothetical protein
VYAVASSCPDDVASLLQAQELVASHELLEAATNPLFDGRPGSQKGYELLDARSPFSAWGACVTRSTVGVCNDRSAQQLSGDYAGSRCCSP